MNKILRLFLLTVTVFISSSCVDEDDPSEAWSLPLGSEMPSFEVTLNDGKRVSNRDLAGKVAVIVLFNTSCGDCRAELPVVQQVSTLTGDNVRYVCIARAEEAASISAFWEEKDLTLPYSPQSDKKVYSLFAESIIPRIMVFSPSGHLTASFSDSPLPTVQTLLTAITNAGL